MSLACQLGRCFCSAEVATGNPHPTSSRFSLKMNLQRADEGISPYCLQ